MIAGSNPTFGTMYRKSLKNRCFLQISGEQLVDSLVDLRSPEGSLRASSFCWERLSALGVSVDEVPTISGHERECLGGMIVGIHTDQHEAL